MIAKGKADAKGGADGRPSELGVAHPHAFTHGFMRPSG